MAGGEELKQGDIGAFSDRADEVAGHILCASRVRLFSHIDADGITAAAIAKAALERAGIPHTVEFLKKLDEAECKRISDAPKDETVWLTDLGAGYLSRLRHPDLVICDHHPLEARRRRDLFDYDEGGVWHLNPHLAGFNGSSHLSGAGATYWAVRAMRPQNRDLSHLAIVGALGDFQDHALRRLDGLNLQPLQDAEERGLVRREHDLRLFGRETKPLTKFFQHSSDPALPGLSNDWYGSRRFLQDRCKVRLHAAGRERTWSELSAEERQRVRDELYQCLEKNGSLDLLERSYGEVYILVKEKPGTELREGKEFATLLNSCGRYGREDLGLGVCLATVHDGSVGGEQKAERLEAALVQLRNHRENLIEALNYFFSEERSGPLLERREGIQVLRPDGSYLLPERVLVDGPEGREEKEVFRDTTVGIVVGMVLGSGKVRDDLPLVSMMRSDGKVKVSARGNRGMIARGLDLSSAMRDAAASVGGTGGGHDIAAGATVPEPRVKDFLVALDGKVAAQLRARPGKIT